MSQSFDYACLPFSRIDSFDDTMRPTILDRTFVADTVRVKFIAWDPLNPPPIPTNASVLWLSCAELTPSNPNRSVADRRSDMIGSWNLSGTVFDGRQSLISLHHRIIQQLHFSLHTNLGEVIISPVNKLVVALDCNEQL